MSMGDDITKSIKADNGMSSPMTVPPSSGEGVRACPPPLDIYRESPKIGGGITEKRSEYKEYTEAEKSAWKARRRAINARLSAISRSWIEEAGLGKRYRGLMECGTVPVEGYNGSVVRYENGAVSYGGVNRCGSAWACPECAGLKLWKASKKIARLLEWLGKENEKKREREENPYSAVLLTLTVPHRAGDSLKNQMAGFSAGFSHLMDSGSVRKAKKALGYRCSVRAFDFTVREVGEVPDWHAHLHCLLVFEGDEIAGVFEDGRYKGGASPSFVYLLETLWGQWSEKTVPKCFGEGVECSPRAFGLEAVRLGGSSAVADYVAKVVSCYISGRSKEKKGEEGRYTPFELLSNRSDGLAFRKRAWLEYVEASKGRRRINFSSGWRDRLGYVDEWDGRDGVDDEAAPPPSWSFNPSADLVALMREKPQMRETAMKLAEMNNPIALVLSLCSPAGGGSPSLAGSGLAGSFIVDNDGSIAYALNSLGWCDGVKRSGDDVVRFVKPSADGSKPSIAEAFDDWSPPLFLGVG